MLPARRNQYWLPSIFNDIFDDDFMGYTPAKQFASPAVNIIENEKDFQIEVAAPGMSKEDFKVRLENDNELVISLEKKNEDKHEKKNYLRREFSYASYKQAFIIPDEVEAEGINASMVDGVLKITLPKKEVTVKTPASRQIEIG
ncbi:MAG: Hsp20/alpha crystallin family protein [Bacteroidales bacterium]|nr:Hsp20/alpha crystallin family protein [Bacteroidales bacterium]MBR4817080.1 Hsp20/alpha crystallin family protein [Bacteroidales bacterium]MBR5072879.1 Hsp20/alpha crystallin family protein [Bacteroidales bacterium]